MSKTYSRAFEKALEQIPTHGHMPFVAIRNALGPVNEEHPFYDSVFLTEAGIDPARFRTAHLNGFAVHTLGMNGEALSPIFRDVIVTRCNMLLEPEIAEALDPATRAAIEQRYNALKR